MRLNESEKNELWKRQGLFGGFSNIRKGGLRHRQGGHGYVYPCVDEFCDGYGLSNRGMRWVQLHGDSGGGGDSKAWSS